MLTLFLRLSLPLPYLLLLALFFVFPLIINQFALFVSLTMADCSSPLVKTVSCMVSKRAQDSQHTRSPHIPLGSLLYLPHLWTPLISPLPARTRRSRCGSWGRPCKMNVWLPSKVMMMQCGQSPTLLTVLISWVEVMIVLSYCGNAQSNQHATANKPLSSQGQRHWHACPSPFTAGPPLSSLAHLTVDNTMMRLVNLIVNTSASFIPDCAFVLH